MAAKKQVRWADLDHSEEPLLEHISSHKGSATQTRGPIPEFLAKKTAEQAPKTAEWYEDALGQFWTFLDAAERATVGDFTVATINLFRIHLKKRGLSENTISNRLRAVRAFGRWMEGQGWIEAHQLKGLKVPQSGKPHFDLITDEMRRSLFELFDSNTFLGSRNLAILAILSDSGLRREEVVNLLIKNVELDTHVVRVFSDKTEEWRYVPLTEETVLLLRNYLKWRQRYFATTSRKRTYSGDDAHRTRKVRTADPNLFFVTWKGTPLAPKELNQIIGRANKKIGGTLHPHLFRHDWITRKAIDGENPSIVRRWAGHKSFAMTDYYFGLAEEMLGAIKPKHSVLTGIPLPGKRGRGRPPKSAV